MMYIVWNLLCLLVILFTHKSNAQEYIVTGVFGEKMLTDSLRLNCNRDGDKIKISDITYATIGCRSSESRPQDPASDRNRNYINQCTGKRTCVVPPDHITRPFIPKKPTSCSSPMEYQISITFTCVAQEMIRSMCSSFSTQEVSGYLSTPSYPMLLKPGVPIAPCRCHLEATLNSKISFTLLETNLGLTKYGELVVLGKVSNLDTLLSSIELPEIQVANTRDLDMNACQSELSKQYLEISYNFGNFATYMLCGHKYNVEMEPSVTYDIMFDNPIKRVAGALWIEYTAIERNAMVQVSCSEPVLTTIAPIHYTNLPRDGKNKGGNITGGLNYRLILGIVAAILFLLIIIAVIIITVKYNRKISHYMMYKYSRNGKKTKEETLPTTVVNPITSDTNGYKETHFDSVDETTSCGKPTAHIPPQLSVNEKLNKVSDEDPKAKLLNGKSKYSSFKSTYLTKTTTLSDSERSESSASKHSGLSDPSPTSETSSAPSVRRVAPPSRRQILEYEEDKVYVQEKRGGPTFEDIWVRVNTPDGTPLSRRTSFSLNNDEHDETGKLIITRPPTDISFSSASSRAQTPSSIPLMHRSEDSRNDSDDDEEMDIKFVNPNLISPYKTPVHIVKPALKSPCIPGRSSSVRRDSVKFSETIHHSPSVPNTAAYYSMSETDAQKRQKIKAAVYHYSLPPSMKEHSLRHHQQTPDASYYDHPKLTVDLPAQQRKSKSLPSYGRRVNSTPSLRGHSQNAKRQKRKCMSDNDKASSSSQEQLNPSPAAGDNYRRGSLTPSQDSRHRSRTQQSLPIGMSRRNHIPDNDDELITKIDNQLDTSLMRGHLK